MDKELAKDTAAVLSMTAASQDFEGVSALSNMGLALAQQGKVDEAVAAFQKCLELDPKAVDIHHRLGNVLRNAHKPAEALSHLREAVKLKPELAELHHSLGLALAD